MRILVTGAAGYIGSHLIPYLLRSQHDVVAIDSGMFGLGSLDPFLLSPRFKLIHGDLRDIQLIRKTVNNIDIVIHLAGLVGNSSCTYDKDLCDEINIKATKNLAEAAASNRVQRFIFASSCSVYGAGDGIFDEKSALNPVDYYAESKIQSEKDLDDYKDKFHLTHCRFATVFGASRRMRFDLAVNAMTANAIITGSINVYGGEQWRPFIHCQDVAKAIQLIVNNESDYESGSIFNIGNPNEVMTLGEVGKIIGKETGAKVAIHNTDIDKS